MSSRLRNQNSKVSFFSFQDIITTVSGILILVTLMLATTLDTPKTGQGEGADPELQKRFEKTIADQVEIDAQNHRLQELLAAAQTGPAVDKLESDISRLRSELAEERRKQTGLTDAVARNEAAMLARDKALGLTDLKASIERALTEAAAVGNLTKEARGQMEKLEDRVAAAKGRLVKLRAREGQLWLIPERAFSSKEAVLVTVSGSGMTLDYFDQPQMRKEANRGNAEDLFTTTLKQMNASNQYVVFLIKPSGIELFRDLDRAARLRRFDVGFDALEEGQVVHFGTPPPLDEEPEPPRIVSSAEGKPGEERPGPGGDYAANKFGGGERVPGGTPSPPGGPPPGGSGRPGFGGPGGMTNANGGTVGGFGNPGGTGGTANTGGTGNPGQPGGAGQSDASNASDKSDNSTRPNGSAGGGSGKTGAGGQPTNSVTAQEGKTNQVTTALPIPLPKPPPPPPPPPPVPKKKTWWQILLEWLGL